MKRPIRVPPLVPFSGRAIRALRRRERASVERFAAKLNLAPELIRQWESGKQQPKGPEVRLLMLAKAKGLASLD